MAAFEDSLPVFFEGLDEDTKFYDDVPAPSEDIWKKFELLPTPPRSPRHSSAFDSEVDYKLPNLDVVSELLETHTQTFIRCLDDTCAYEGDMQSKLIQDCMWSTGGFTTHVTQGTDISRKPRKSEDSKSDDSNPASVEIPSSECVDPISVFPFPLNDTRNIERQSSCTEISSCLTPSDSEEEEIDVVTVEKQHQMAIHQRRSVMPSVMPAATSMSAQVAAMHNYSHTGPMVVIRSAPHSPVHPRHHSVKRLHSASSPGSPQPIVKRHRSGINEAELRTVVQRLNMKNGHGYSSSRSSSHTSSDSEEFEGKRAQHNVLERKRRNDLKHSFLQLRDNLPEVNQEKAAKVVILRHAVDYITRLQQTERTLNRELEEEQRRHEKLQQRLAMLGGF